MTRSDNRKGLEELRAVRRSTMGALTSVFLFSIFVNLLMLTGPLYMLQVYDRVLGSRSEETLLALSLLVTFLFVAMGVLDHARARVMRAWAQAFRRSSTAASSRPRCGGSRSRPAIRRPWQRSAISNRCSGSGPRRC